MLVPCLLFAVHVSFEDLNGLARYFIIALVDLIHCLVKLEVGSCHFGFFFFAREDDWYPLAWC